MSNLDKAIEKFQGSLVDVDPDVLSLLERSILKVEPGNRGFDRFMVTEIIRYRDSDDDLIAVVCASVAGTGTARAFWVALEKVVLR